MALSIGIKLNCLIIILAINFYLTLERREYPEEYDNLDDSYEYQEYYPQNNYREILGPRNYKSKGIIYEEEETFKKTKRKYSDDSDSYRSPFLASEASSDRETHEDPVWRDNPVESPHKKKKNKKINIKKKNSKKEVKKEYGLSFARNHTMFPTHIPKTWIKEDKESANNNAKAEEEALEFENIPRNKRIVLRSTETEIMDYLLPNCGKTKVNSARIVGGKNAKEGSYPWVVIILNNGDPWCGGSILNDRWIITAAHCFMLDRKPELFSIRVGSVDRTKGTLYKISKVIMHERFHLDNMFNSDIALLKTSKKIAMTSTVSGVCLPTITYEDPTTSDFIVVGWGQPNFLAKGEFPKILQEVTLKNKQLIQCSKKYKEKNTVIYRSQICTWTEGKDGCQGDSGSPSMEMRAGRIFQIGIVSYGSTCADDYPGVFTRISYFLSWIIKTIKANG